MSDAGFQEFPINPESRESLRSLVSSIGTDQLKALGYEDTLSRFKEWFTGNPLEGIKFSGGARSEFIEQFREGLLEGYLSELKRIPDQDEARKLVSAAIFGIPFSEGKRRIVIASYRLEEPSYRTTMKEFDPNKDSKHKRVSVPNLAGSRFLVGKVANTGFLSVKEVPLDVIRRVSWGSKTFEGVYQKDPSVVMKITPSDSAFRAEIHKSL